MHFSRKPQRGKGPASVSLARGEATMVCSSGVEFGQILTELCLGLARISGAYVKGVRFRVTFFHSIDLLSVR